MKIFALVMSTLAILALMVHRKDQPNRVNRDEIDDSWFC